MQPIPPATIAAKVRTLRVAAGLTQQDLAMHADLALRTIARIEGGENATLPTLRAIAQVLDIELVELLEAS